MLIVFERGDAWVLRDRTLCNMHGQVAPAIVIGFFNLTFAHPQHFLNLLPISWYSPVAFGSLCSI
jgi:hypothetical protein